MLHSILARFVALVGAAMIVIRRASGGVQQPVYGPNPNIPAPVSQGAMPNLKMPTARGWRGDEKPVAAPASRATPSPAISSTRGRSMCCPMATCSPLNR